LKKDFEPKNIGVPKAPKLDLPTTPTTITIRKHCNFQLPWLPPKMCIWCGRCM